ncbi:hypothetical protein [Propionivibrio sp.]|uniref:hypothetical protein n=1 Tax=Propionivibrio sp. TaxID=2212460 RepID=UPI003BF2F3C7
MISISEMDHRRKSGVALEKAYPLSLQGASKNDIERAATSTSGSENERLTDCRNPRDLVFRKRMGYSIVAAVVYGLLASMLLRMLNTPGEDPYGVKRFARHRAVRRLG